MLRPSYGDLINVVNSGVEQGEHPLVQSRYSIVLATAKRARQIISGDDPMVPAPMEKKPLSVAVEELYKGKVKILGAEDEEENEETGNGETASEAAPEEAMANETAMGEAVVNEAAAGDVMANETAEDETAVDEATENQEPEIAEVDE